MRGGTEQGGDRKGGPLLLPLQCGPSLVPLHHEVRPRAFVPPAVTLAAPQLAAWYAQQAGRVASLTEHLSRRLSGAVRGAMAHAWRQIFARDEGDRVRRRVVQREAQRHVGMPRIELQHRELAASQRARDRDPVGAKHDGPSPR